MIDVFARGAGYLGKNELIKYNIHCMVIIQIFQELLTLTILNVRPQMSFS